jgi:hypothetical protein
LNSASGYFDGSDYLNTDKNVGLSLGTNTWTIGVWVYTTVAASQYFISQTSGGTSSTSNFGLNASLQPALQIYQNGTNRVFSTATNAIVTGQWNYVTLTHTGSGTYQFHVNGVAQTATGNTGFYWNGTLSAATVTAIGYYNYSSSSYMNGFLANLRVKQGVDTAIPTAPLTPTSSDILLLNFANAGILDQTGKNVLETLGNAQVDTNIKQFGLGSMKFDGAGDSLFIPTSNDFAFSNGNFTIEMWIYPVTASNVPYILDCRSTSSASQSVPTIYIDSSRNLVYWVGGNNRIYSNTTLTLNTWSFIAIAREGTVSRMYINGVLAGSFTDTYVYIPTAMRIGRRTDDNTQFFNGYIDDLRITKGLARYTANFTPPTAAFQDQ